MYQVNISKHSEKVVTSVLFRNYRMTDMGNTICPGHKNSSNGDTLVRGSKLFVRKVMFISESFKQLSRNTFFLFNSLGLHCCEKI